MTYEERRGAVIQDEACVQELYKLPQRECLDKSPALRESLHVQRCALHTKHCMLLIADKYPTTHDHVRHVHAEVISALMQGWRTCSYL